MSVRLFLALTAAALLVITGVAWVTSDPNQAMAERVVRDAGVHNTTARLVPVPRVQGMTP